MSKAAAMLGLSNARAYHRYETGENRPDAHIVERIIAVSQGSVGLSDLHAQRLAWMRQHHPELLEFALEAAE